MMAAGPEFPPHLRDDEPVLFLCDVHLGAFPEAVNCSLEEDLLGLIDYAEKHHIRLVILGDLFDYWMEYPGFVPGLGRRLRERFRRYHHKMGAGLFVTGNHDYWTRHHFRDLGFDVEPEFRELKLGDKTGLLLHGDGLSDGKMDFPRPLLHRILRNDRFLTIYQRLLSPETGILCMHYFSKITRLRERYSNNGTAKLDHWVQQTLENTRFDFVICGHHHHERFVQSDSGMYINPGAWFRNHTLVLHSRQKFTLVNWHGSRNELLPHTSYN